MIVTIALWTGVVLALIAAGAVVVAVRRFVPPQTSLRKTLGFFPLTALALGAMTAVLALLTALWVDRGERHTVHLQPARPLTSTCAFRWPTGSAPTQQTVDCPLDAWDASGADHVAVRLPGTDHVTVLDGGTGPFDDPYSGPMQGAALVFVLAGGFGLVLNAVKSSRVTSDEERARLETWHRDAARPSTTDDLTWESIAERSERADVHGGPLVHPERFVGIPLTGATLTMQYPYSYVRVMTREPAERSVVLLFVDEDAWRLDVDGVPPRSGTATVSRVPSAPGDLHVTIDGYAYDIEDDPTFLPSASLESLRRQCSTWLTPAATDEAPHANTTKPRDVSSHPDVSQP